MAAPLGSTERTNELLAGASKITGIAAPTFPVNKPVDVNVPSVLPTGVTTGVGQTDQPALPQGVDFNLPKKDVVPSSALVGGRTPTEIMNRRSELEQQFLAASKPSELELGLSEQLNSVKQLSRRAQLDLNRETERLQTDGGISKSISNQWTSDFARRMSRTIGDLGVGASGLADALNAEVSRRTVSTDGITKLMQFDKENIGILQDLQKMTMPEMIGSPQVNEMTGEVTAFQRDPQTGAITSSVIGNVGSTKKYIQSGTYKDPATGAETFWGLGADGMIETQVMSGAGIDGDAPTIKSINGKDMQWNTQTQGWEEVEVSSTADPMALAQVQANVTQIAEVMNDKYLRTAVGANPLGRISFSNAVTGGKSNFIAGIEQLRTQLSLDSLIRAKANGATFGALSDTEMQVLSASASKLSTWAIKDDAGNVKGYKASEKDFKRELDKISNFAILDYLKKGGNPGSVGLTQLPDGNYSKQNSDGSVQLFPQDRFNSAGKPQASKVEKVMEAIGKFESGGKYTAMGPTTAKGDRAYGKYQVMGANIPSWTKAALGQSLTPQQFLSSPQAQDAVAKYQMGMHLANGYDVEDVASIWFSGRPMKKAGNSKDILGTTVPKYVANIRSIYNKL